jgi:hypothetical protein
LKNFATGRRTAIIVLLVLAMLAWSFGPRIAIALNALRAKNTVPAGSLIAVAPASVLVGGVR